MRGLPEWIDDDVFYIAFLLGFVAILTIALYQTYQFRDPQAGLVPRIIIIPTIILFLLEISRVILIKLGYIKSGAIISEYDLDSDDEIIEDDSAEDDGTVSLDELQEEGQVALKEEIPASRIIKICAITTAFVLSMYYIGFFTTTIAFPLIYIFLKEKDRDLPHRVAYAVIPTAALNIFLWIVFIEIMRTVALFRLGIFM